MSRIQAQSGWLLSAISLHGRTGVLTGDVLTWELSASRYDPVLIRAEFRLARGTQLDNGDAGVAMWRALQKWPDENAGRRWPPEMAALLELARRHPGEYEELREGEAVIRALGGLSWAYDSACYPG